MMIEGDAIAWHCGKILGLNFKEKNRIKFTEITKKGYYQITETSMELDMGC